MKRQRTVFVSYAQADREFAHRLVNAVAEKLPPNINFVLDVDVASPGDNVFVGVAETLSKADALIVIISQASTSSAWVRSEVAWALAQKDGKLPIFPVLNGPPDALPHLLRSRVYIDFSESRNFEENIARLATAILRTFESPRSIDSEYASYLARLEDNFIGTEHDILERGRRSELFRKRLLNAKLIIGILWLIALLVFVALFIITLESVGIFKTKGDLLSVISIVIAPICGLVGIVAGFYYGRYSATRIEAEERATLKQEPEAS